jgi:hypothetical protein
MSRLMSVALTEQAVRDRRKTVTRRLGWRFLKPGDRLTLCRKVQGRTAGEPLVRLTDVEVVSVRPEPLYMIQLDDREVEREGFPVMTGRQFVEFFCRHMRCQATTEVTRIEWRYLDPPLANLTPARVTAQPGRGGSLVAAAAPAADGRHQTHTSPARGRGQHITERSCHEQPARA